nr:hypothetical protein [Tanacetum cinerariifolium]
ATAAGEEAGASRYSGYVPAGGRPHRAFGGAGGHFWAALLERREICQEVVEEGVR